MGSTIKLKYQQRVVVWMLLSSYDIVSPNDTRDGHYPINIDPFSSYMNYVSSVHYTILNRGFYHEYEKEILNKSKELFYKYRVTKSPLKLKLSRRYLEIFGTLKSPYNTMAEVHLEIDTTKNTYRSFRKNIESLYTTIRK